MAGEENWKRFQQLLGQTVLDVFRNIGPPPDTVDVNETPFSAWSGEAGLPEKYPIVVSIQYEGLIEGNLWFAFSRGMVNRVAKAFLDATIEDLGSITSDCRDAVAEAANQVAGDLNIRLRKLYGDGISVQAPKGGSLPDILKSDDGAFLAGPARMVLATVNTERGETLALLPDSKFSRRFQPEPAPAPAAAPPQAQAAAAPAGAAPAAAAPRPAAPEATAPQNIELILDISLDVVLRVGSRKMCLKDIMGLSSGTVIELDKSISDPVEVRVNDKVVAYGEVVVAEGNYAIRITEIANRMERIRSLA